MESNIPVHEFYIKLKNFEPDDTLYLKHAIDGLLHQNYPKLYTIGSIRIKAEPKKGEVHIYVPYINEEISQYSTLGCPAMISEYLRNSPIRKHLKKARIEITYKSPMQERVIL